MNNKIRNRKELEAKLFETNDDTLVLALLANCIDLEYVKTFHEYNVAYETLEEQVGDWDIDEGFGTSDRSYVLNKIKKVILEERKHG